MANLTNNNPGNAMTSKKDGPVQERPAETQEQKVDRYKIEVFSGIRPTGYLTLGNYVGAVKNFITLQERGFEPLIFVADLHALTDREPVEAAQFRREVVADYVGLGMDPERCQIFVQSEIESELFTMTAYLMRHISVAELIRVPTLKDKLKNNENPENANALLAAYPVLMAADIILQRPRLVPVGEDQLAHMEVTRKIIRRFNNRYGNGEEILPIPEPEEFEAIRILGLQGSGKMSKSVPNEAVFLNDSPNDAAKKVKRATTAIEGEMNNALKSNITLAKGLARDAGTMQEIDEFVERHLAGEKVMGGFKKLLGGLVVDFLEDFQQRRAEFVSDPSYMDRLLVEGAEIARANAQETLAIVKSAMGAAQA